MKKCIERFQEEKAEADMPMVNHSRSTLPFYLHMQGRAKLGKKDTSIQRLLDSVIIS